MNKILIIILILLRPLNSTSQNNENGAKEYFSKYLNNNDQISLIAKSLPTLEQCKLVFEGENATTYYNFVLKLNEQIKTKISELNYEEHTDCKIDSFNTNDLLAENGNYNRGMVEIIRVFKPNITFYRLTYLFNDGSESYNSVYKFFVNIKGDWIFFANPAIVFRN